MRIFAFLVLLCACPPSGIQKTQHERSTTAKQVKRFGLADFERARSQTSFIPQASVIWSPELPTRSDRLTVFYNSASRLSRCAVDQLTLIVVPLAGGQPVKKAMQRGRDGIFYHVFQPSGLPRPGFMYFATARGQQCDDNHGSPWKLPVVDKLPDYRVARSTFFDFYYLAQDRFRVRTGWQASRISNCRSKSRRLLERPQVQLQSSQASRRDTTFAPLSPLATSVHVERLQSLVRLGISPVRPWYDRCMEQIRQGGMI